MALAYTIAPGKGDTDALLAQVAETLAERGISTCGTVQINTENADGALCDMDVKVLPNGPVFRISQTLGRNATGCRLDPDALEQAVAWSEPRLASAQLLIVNKFGKHEIGGRGFRGLIAEAAARDIPVLVGMNAMNVEAFQTFAEGAAEEIAANPADLIQWAMREMTSRHACAS